MMVDKPARRQKRVKNGPKSQSNLESKSERKPMTAREKLMAAGILATNLVRPDEMEYMTDEEIAEIGFLEPGDKSLDELISEDRGLY